MGGGRALLQQYGRRKKSIVKRWIRGAGRGGVPKLVFVRFQSPPIRTT